MCVCVWTVKALEIKAGVKIEVDVQVDVRCLSLIVNTVLGLRVYGLLFHRRLAVCYPEPVIYLFTSPSIDPFSFRCDPVLSRDTPVRGRIRHRAVISLLQ